MNHEHFKEILIHKENVGRRISPTIDQLSSEIGIDGTQIAALAISALADKYFPNRSGDNSVFAKFELREGEEIHVQLKKALDAWGREIGDGRVILSIPGSFTPFDEPEHAIFCSSDTEELDDSTVISSNISV